MNISVKELKEKESSKVEEISWNISNRMRELGNTSVYGGFCLSYVAYLSLKNKINDVYQLVEYMELTFSPERVSFIKGNIENLWNMAIEIGEAYSEETLLAVVLWWPLQGNKFMGECETPQSVVKLANEILQISNDKTADFCSGIGTFLVNAIERNPESQFYGVELVTEVKEVAEIRTELISDQVKIEQKSVLDIDDNLMFDKIFCDYPWGISKNTSGNCFQWCQEMAQNRTDSVSAGRDCQDRRDRLSFLHDCSHGQEDEFTQGMYDTWGNGNISCIAGICLHR